MNLHGKKALVVGLGVSGKSAVTYLLHKGAHVCAIDSKISEIEKEPAIIDLKKEGLETKNDAPIHNLDAFDFIIMSPGIPPSHHIYKHNTSNIPIFGEIELGCLSVSNRMVGITGSNGKTTVTALITHVINHSGKKARAVGNIGIPLTRELLTAEKDEILVLELSSYQLETMTQKVLDAAVILNITPNHLDRHLNMQAYATAKLNIERCLKEKGSLYIEENAYHTYGKHLNKISTKLLGYSQNNFISSDLQHMYANGTLAFTLPEYYHGKATHNLENLQAAYALCREMGISENDFLQALPSFKKPPHRIEFVTEKNGISYYDDSKGTSIEAVIRAVESLNGQIILIAGGYDKGCAYTPWIKAFANKVKSICAIGQAACKIKEQLSDYIPVTIYKDMEQAVRQAASLAKKGEIVLLSPGCASWDMFRDFNHRGEEFQRIVKEM